MYSYKKSPRRKDNRDSDEVPPAVKAHNILSRQWDVAPVAENVVDDVADEEHSELKLSSHGRKVKNFERYAVEIEGPLITCSLDIGDWELISAFAERWHKKTSSFHLPVGEVTIILNYMASLLHLPVTGAFHSFETLHVDEAVLLLVELLEMSVDEARAEIVQCHGAYE
ncbi:Protein MAIN-LIKE 1 [Glycine soja]